MSNNIPSFKNHICYVSDQTIANLLPCMKAELKPEKVFLLTTQEMIEKGVYDKLANNFKKLGIKVEKKLFIKDIPFKALSDLIYNYIIELLDKGIENIAFNFTGGTKLMTLAAYEACKGNIPMFYVNTSDNKLLLLDKDIKEEYPLQDVCSVVNILNAYGYRKIAKEKNPQNNGQLIQYFLNCHKKNLFFQLNKLAGNAGDKNANLTAYLNPKDNNPQLDNLLKECEKAGLLTISNDTIIFKDEYSRSFCNGIWLEEYTAYSLEQLKKKQEISDFEGSVEIIYNDRVVSNKDANPDNELDALFVRNNMLYLLECKTMKMKNNKKTRDILYKLDSLQKNIGGVFAKGVLISLYELDEDEKKHAKETNIIVIDEIQKIKNLQKTFIELFTGKNR